MSLRLLIPTSGQYGEVGGDVTAPLPPAGGALDNYTASSVRISWLSNSEPDLQEYRVYKSTTSADDGYTQIPIALTVTNYTDNDYDPSVQTWYKLSAVDTAGNESELSDAITDVTSPGTPLAPTVADQTETSITINLPAEPSADHDHFEVHVGLAGGALTLHGNATAVTYPVTGLVADTSYDIAVLSEDVAGNQSSLSSRLTASTAASAALKLPSVVQNTRWLLAGSATNSQHMGPGWLANRSDETLSFFALVMQRFLWSHIEGPGSGTTSGTYDFSAIEEMLNACRNRGIPFAAMPMWRKFDTASHSTPWGTTDGIMPLDLQSQYQYDIVSHTVGNCSSMWVSTVRRRFQNLCEALYDRFGDDEYFWGVATEETAMGDLSEMNSAAGPNYDLPDWQEQMRILYEEMADYAAAYRCWWNPGWNFVPSGAGTTAARLAVWQHIFGNIRTDNTVLYTPDLFANYRDHPNNHWNGVNNQVYPFVHQSYSGVTAPQNNFTYIGHFQNDSYRGNGIGGSGPDGLYTMDEMEIISRDRFPNMGVIVYTYQNWWIQRFDQAINGAQGDGVAAARRPWGRAAADTAYLNVPPVVSAVEIGANGNRISIFTNVPLSAGSGGGGTLSVSMSGGAVTATYNAAVSTSSYRSFDLSRTVSQGETGTATYSNPGDGLQITSNGRDLDDFTMTVTNLSTQ